MLCPRQASVFIAPDSEMLIRFLHIVLRQPLPPNTLIRPAARAKHTFAVQPTLSTRSERRGAAGLPYTRLGEHGHGQARSQNQPPQDAAQNRASDGHQVAGIDAQRGEGHLKVDTE